MKSSDNKVRTSYFKKPKFLKVNTHNIVNMCMLFMIIYESFDFLSNTKDIEHIPLIKSSHYCIKYKFYKNDGLIFSNQEKLFFDKMQQDSKVMESNNVQSEKLMLDFSHREIFNIIKKLKKDSINRK